MLKHFRRLLGKCTYTDKCVGFVNGRPQAEENPLPQTFPLLYEQPPEDGFRLRDKMVAEATDVLKNLLFSLCIDTRKGTEAYLPNICLFLEIPMIYDSMRHLRALDDKGPYERTIALAGLFQICASQGDSRSAQNAVPDLFPAMLGIFCRLVGLSNLNASQKQTLLSRVKYDVSDPRQKELRDQFLKDYGAANALLAELSVKKISGILANVPEETAKIVRDIVLYSSRLTGRACGKIDQQVLKSIHGQAHYLATLYGIVSAFANKKKRPVLVLAEEWSRIESDCSSKLLEDMSGRSPDAVRDVMHAARCVVLRNFQGTGHEAFYSVPENILAKQVEIRAEVDPNESKRILRYTSCEKEIKRARLQSIRRFARKDTKVEADEVQAPKLVKHLRWACFKPKEHIDIENRSRKDLQKKNSGHQLDPSDAELTILD